jgi:vancomycin resistance protein YoaR
MPDKDTFTERHNHSSEFIFRFKSGVLIALRALKDTFHTRHKKFSAGNELRNEQVISFSESDLWNAGDNEENWILTAGKVQNLRIAARKLHGIEIPSHKVFSFWKHIGIPNKRRGYVVGREIREGCIVPTIAGGLCQLSNALYDAALKAGFEIVERHKHTRVIKGSLAEQDRDATVKWNYIDLRFKSRHAFRIEANINADKLLITFKGTQSKEEKNAITGSRIPPSKLNPTAKARRNTAP